jgi:signal transduction histidine kinase
LKPVDLNLNQLVAETLETLTWGPGVGLLSSQHPLPNIFADPEQLQNVITNLLLNARDAVGESGQITVETNTLDGRVVLTVSDDGCGMNPSFLRDSLFRPFHTTKKEGLGIGLFQSKMIVEAHRGTIQVESERDKGTTFCVFLPVAYKDSGLANRKTPVDELELTAEKAELQARKLNQSGFRRNRTETKLI